MLFPRPRHAVLFALVFFALSRIASAASLVLDAGLDTSLYDESGDLANGAGPALFAGTNSFGNERRALLRFDLSAIPGNAHIDSASLRLYATSIAGNGTGRVLALHPVESPWGEGGSSSGSNTGGGGSGDQATPGDATWTDNVYSVSAWQVAGGDLADASAMALAQIGVIEWTGAGLVGDVQAWIDGRLSNNGWIVLGDASVGASAVRFGSRENGIAAYRPVLELGYTTAVPLPSALGLFAAGLLTLLARGRQRR